jgi:hypothetical protein
MRTTNFAARRFSLRLGGTVLACGAVLTILASAYPARADGPQHLVAVTQFNSNVPELPGQYVRDMLAGALMKSGVFSVSPQNGGGTEYIFDGVVTEVQPGKNKPGFVDILKEMGQGVQASINLDVRVTDARTGQWVESISINSRDLKAKKLSLGDIAGLLENKPPGNQPPDMNTAVRARRDSMNQALGTCVTEAANRIASKYGQPRTQAPGTSPGDPGNPPTQAPPFDPNQTGLPPAQPGAPGFGQPGYGPTQMPPTGPNQSAPYPYGSSPSPYGMPGPPQSGYPSSQYPPSQYPPTGAYPSGPPPMQPGAPGYGQPGYGPTQMPPTGPNQSAPYPYGSSPNPYGAPGPVQPGYPSSPYPPTGAYPPGAPPMQPGAPGYGQPGYGPNQFGAPPNFSGGPGYPQPGFVPNQPVPPGMYPPAYPGNQPPPGYYQPPVGGYRGVEEPVVEGSEQKDSGAEGPKDK